MAITGHVPLSSLDDGALIIVIEGKRSYPGFAFDPTTMQMQMQMQGDSKSAANKPLPANLYKDVTLNWEGPKGLGSAEAIPGKLRLY